MENISRRGFVTGVGALSAGAAACSVNLTGAKAAETVTETVTLPSSQPFEIHIPAAGEVAFVEGEIADIAQTVETDVVVCGAGVAGIACAASCAENGLATVLLEKGGIYAARGGDLACVGDSVHKEAGVELDPEAIVSDMMLSSGYRASEAVVRRFVYNSGAAADWLLDCVGRENAGDYHIKFADGTLVTGGVNWWATQIEFTGWYSVIGLLLDYAVANGAEVLYETPACQLVTDGEGAVTGVIAKNADGTYTRYNAAKGVVLATGSYEYNPDMLKSRIRPRDLVIRLWMNPTTTDTGDGHLMGLAVGAVEDEYPHAVMTDPSGNEMDSYGPKIGMKPFLRVNDNGERFVNENIPWDCLANAINSQMGGHAFCLCDDDMVAHMEQMADVHDYAVPFEDDYTEMVEQCTSADTLEELAEKMGVPVDTFVTAVERYNQLCAAGKDDDFNKDAKYLCPMLKPPFYFFDEGTMSLVTVSGLRVDAGSGVISNETHTPIPGLYAIGNASGSMFENFYPHHINGVSHGRCLTAGYLLGKDLAQAQG